MEWVMVKHKEIFFDHGSKTVRTPGPIKVSRGTFTALGFDGIDFEVEWHPLDQNGKWDPSVKVPDAPRKRRGGHTNVFTTSEEVIEPPFEHPYGWDVTIKIPPQATYNANSGGCWLNVYVPKGKKGK